MEKAQKELAEQKLDLEEYKGKLELTEKSNTEICSNLEEVKIEVHRLQESIKRYVIYNFNICLFSEKNHL